MVTNKLSAAFIFYRDQVSNTIFVYSFNSLAQILMRVDYNVFNKLFNNIKVNLSTF